MKKILFITWDGPQTSYMEGLFMPILSEVQNKGFSIHVLQFTWGSAERVLITKKKADDLNIIYSTYIISRKPNAILGSMLTLYKGIKFIKSYISKNKIDIVMPRSTMPAVMLNRIKNNDFKIVFDADGLPIEERVDFAGLSRNSIQYRFFLNEEKKMLLKADRVITRTQKSIDYHLAKIGEDFRNKMDVVSNGRDVTFFVPDIISGLKRRANLGIGEKDKVFLYCGSLGAQYGWDDMIAIFTKYHQKKSNSKFLVLTGNPEFTNGKIPSILQDAIIIKSVPFQEVPDYLNIGDIAFAIREPKLSMIGVAPIKLGEYLLMGIPTIASAGIGDTEKIIDKAPYCYLYDHKKPNRVVDAHNFIQQLNAVNIQEIRDFGMKYFSIEHSADTYLESLNKL